MKHYLRQLSQVVILNFLFFLLLIVFLTGIKRPTPVRIPAPVPSAITENISPAPSPGQEPSPAPSPPADKFSELGNHNNPSDCWIAINGNIYDVTSYFGSHPGGDGMLGKYCGQDASSGFATKDKSPGQDHSAGAYSMLQPYLIQ
jgi:predicted heme/steroid binding protein